MLFVWSRYYSQQLDYDLESTGIMIALPMLIGVISAALGGLAADAVLSRGYAVSSVRRYALRTQLLRPTDCCELHDGRPNFLRSLLLFGSGCANWP